MSGPASSFALFTTIGAMLLLSVGLLVALRGWQRQRAGLEDPPLAFEAELPDASPLAAHLIWRPVYETGYKPIDDHHRDIVARGNVIIGAAMDGESTVVVGREFQALIADVATHFQEEESMLHRIRPDMVQRHRVLHNDILDRAVRLRLQLDRGGVPTTVLIDFLGCKLLLDHIVNEDLPLLRRSPEAT